MPSLNTVARPVWRAINQRAVLPIAHRLDPLVRTIRLHPGLQRTLPPRLLPKFYSQWGEDRMLLPFLTKGWILDIGANDGLRGSNSRHFALRGWPTLCVEPDPRMVLQLRALYRGQDQVRIFAGGCGREDVTLPLMFGPTSPENSSFVTNGHSDVENVPVRRLNTLCQMYGVKEIAVASIDVEGLEWDVIQGFDLQRYRPRAIILETHSDFTGDTCPDLDRIAAHFRRHGYTPCGITKSNSLWASTPIPWLTKGWQSSRADELRSRLAA